MCGLAPIKAEHLLVVWQSNQRHSPFYNPMKPYVYTFHKQLWFCWLDFSCTKTYIQTNDRQKCSEKGLMKCRTLICRIKLLRRNQFSLKQHVCELCFSGLLCSCRWSVYSFSTCQVNCAWSSHCLSSEECLHLVLPPLSPSNPAITLDRTDRLAGC